MAENIFVNAVDVELSCVTEGATITYALTQLQQEDPKPPLPLVYTSPFTISRSRKLTVQSTKESWLPSEVETEEIRIQLAPPILTVEDIPGGIRLSFTQQTGAQINFTVDSGDPIVYSSPYEIKRNIFDASTTVLIQYWASSVDSVTGYKDAEDSEVKESVLTISSSELPEIDSTSVRGGKNLVITHANSGELKYRWRDGEYSSDSTGNPVSTSIRSVDSGKVEAYLIETGKFTRMVSSLDWSVSKLDKPTISKEAIYDGYEFTLTCSSNTSSIQYSLTSSVPSINSDLNKVVVSSTGPGFSTETNYSALSYELGFVDSDIEISSYQIPVIVAPSVSVTNSHPAGKTGYINFGQAYSDAKFEKIYYWSSTGSYVVHDSATYDTGVKGTSAQFSDTLNAFIRSKGYATTSVVSGLIDVTKLNAPEYTSTIIPSGKRLTITNVSDYSGNYSVRYSDKSRADISINSPQFEKDATGVYLDIIGTQDKTYYFRVYQDGYCPSDIVDTAIGIKKLAKPSIQISNIFGGKKLTISGGYMTAGSNPEVVSGTITMHYAVHYESQYTDTADYSGSSYSKEVSITEEDSGTAAVYLSCDGYTDSDPFTLQWVVTKITSPQILFEDVYNGKKLTFKYTHGVTVSGQNDLVRYCALYTGSASDTWVTVTPNTSSSWVVDYSTGSTIYTNKVSRIEATCWGYAANSFETEQWSIIQVSDPEIIENEWISDGVNALAESGKTVTVNFKSSDYPTGTYSSYYTFPSRAEAPTTDNSVTSDPIKTAGSFYVSARIRRLGYRDSSVVTSTVSLTALTVSFSSSPFTDVINGKSLSVSYNGSVLYAYGPRSDVLYNSSSVDTLVTGNIDYIGTVYPTQNVDIVTVRPGYARATGRTSIKIDSLGNLSISPSPISEGKKITMSLMSTGYSVYYTANGSDLPDSLPESATLYTDPVSQTGASIVTYRARAYQPGKITSAQTTLEVSVTKIKSPVIDSQSVQDYLSSDVDSSGRYRGGYSFSAKVIYKDLAENTVSPLNFRCKARVADSWTLKNSVTSERVSWGYAIESGSDSACIQAYKDGYESSDPVFVAYDLQACDSPQMTSDEGIDYKTVTITFSSANNKNYYLDPPVVQGGVPLTLSSSLVKTQTVPFIYNGQVYYTSYCRAYSCRLGYASSQIVELSKNLPVIDKAPAISSIVVDVSGGKKFTVSNAASVSAIIKTYLNDVEVKSQELSPGDSYQYSVLPSNPGNFKVTARAYKSEYYHSDLSAPSVVLIKKLKSPQAPSPSSLVEGKSYSFNPVKKTTAPPNDTESSVPSAVMLYRKDSGSWQSSSSSVTFNHLEVDSSTVYEAYMYCDGYIDSDHVYQNVNVSQVGLSILVSQG